MSTAVSTPSRPKTPSEIIEHIRTCGSQSVYVINTYVAINETIVGTGKRTKVERKKFRADVSFLIKPTRDDPANNITVYNSWLPQDVAVKATIRELVASPGFRTRIMDRALEYISTEEAERVLMDPSNQAEKLRLENLRNGRIDVPRIERVEDDQVGSTNPLDGRHPILIDLFARASRDPKDPTIAGHLLSNLPVFEDEDLRIALTFATDPALVEAITKRLGQSNPTNALL